MALTKEERRIAAAAAREFPPCHSSYWVAMDPETGRTHR